MVRVLSVPCSPAVRLSQRALPGVVALCTGVVALIPVVPGNLGGGSAPGNLGGGSAPARRHPGARNVGAAGQGVNAMPGR